MQTPEPSAAKTTPAGGTRDSVANAATMHVEEFKQAAKRYYNAAQAVRVAAETLDAPVPVTERDEAWDEFAKLMRRPDVMDAVVEALFWPESAA